MISKIKGHLYFVGARYFRFFAAIKLRRWSPKVIVVTGSAGKTTLLHLLEAQLGQKAHYSHHANSAYGISYDILGLTGVQRSKLDFLLLFMKAPFKVFTPVHPEKLYVAEVDTDRPGEATFLASLLKPSITLWVSILHTHTMRFDTLVDGKHYTTPEQAIAYDYGSLMTKTSQLVVINADSPLMAKQVDRTKADVKQVKLADLDDYKLGAKQTQFSFGGKTYIVPAVVPKATYYQVAMTDMLMQALELVPDYSCASFVLPPGRSNVFAGQKGTILLDSTYNNSNLESLKEVLDMFAAYPAQHKWAVVGDMLEQGQDEEREHQKLAELLNDKSFDRLVLVGPRVAKSTLPHLKAKNVVAFDRPKEVLDYLNAELKGGETVLFKGVRFLEGVIEALLADRADIKLLPRREAVWQKRRKEWDL